MHWATRASITSSPVTLSNRYAALGDEEYDYSDGGRYTEVLSKQAKKRLRQASDLQFPQSRQQQQQSSASVSTVNQPRPQQNNRRQQAKRVLLGKSNDDNCKLSAAKEIKEKVVFCLDNVSTNVDADDVRAYVKRMSIDVVSCFQVQRRRFRYDTEPVADRKAFRLCIFKADRDRLLDESKWPHSVTISEWYRKSAASNRQQQSRQQSINPAMTSISADTVPKTTLASMSTASTATITVNNIVQCC